MWSIRTLTQPQRGTAVALVSLIPKTLPYAWRHWRCFGPLLRNGIFRAVPCAASRLSVRSPGLLSLRLSDELINRYDEGEAGQSYAYQVIEQTPRNEHQEEPDEPS